MEMIMEIIVTVMKAFNIVNIIIYFVYAYSVITFM